MKAWYRCDANGLRLSLYVQPGAKKTEWCGEHDGALKLRLNAPPVGGKANQVLVAWLAKTLGLPLRSVQLVSGEKSRHKVLAIDATFSLAELASRLGLPVE
jgi:uncharacterized protein (TIGR00251 family)